MVQSKRSWSLLPCPTTLAFTLVVFVSVRVVITAGSLIGSESGLKPPLNVLGDVGWYLGVAEQGYPHGAIVPGEQSAFAFFPLLPLLTKLVAAVGIPPLPAGMMVACSASLLGAWAMYRIGQHLYSDTVGFYLAISWAVIPAANIALSLPLSESLFTVCAAWCMLFLLRQELVFSALCAVLAGLTRPTAIAVVIAVLATVVVNLFHRRNVLKSLAAALIAPLGLAGYAAFVAMRSGELGGYFTAQKGWGSEFNFGKSWIGIVRVWMAQGLQQQIDWATVATLSAAIVLFIFMIATRLPLPLIAYVATLLVLILMLSAIEFQLERLIIPAFPLLIPLARGFSRMPWIASCLILVGFMSVSVYHSIYLISHVSVPFFSAG